MFAEQSSKFGIFLEQPHPYLWDIYQNPSSIIL